MRLLVYLSTASTEFTDEMLTDLLKSSRSNNEKLGITGMLLYHDGSFIQAIEGEDEVVEKLYQTIITDERHKSTIVLINKPIESRIFKSWSMGFKKISAEEENQYLNSDQSLDDFVNNPHAALKLLEMFKKNISL